MEENHHIIKESKDSFLYGRLICKSFKVTGKGEAVFKGGWLISS